MKITFTIQQFPTTAIFAFMLITLKVIIHKEKLPECPSDSQCPLDVFLKGKSFTEGPKHRVIFQLRYVFQ